MRTVLLMLATLVIVASISDAYAVSPDIRKSDFIVTANTKDSSSALISVSVEWESNISITSQAKNNIRASTEMAIIEESKKYNVNELQSSMPAIQDNVLSTIQSSTADSNIIVKDVAITRIVPKETFDANKAACQPEKIYTPYMSWWTYIFVIAALIVGIIVGNLLSGKSNIDKQTDN